MRVGIDSRSATGRGSLSIHWLVGALLPLPIFLEFSTAGVALANPLGDTALPPLPVSMVVVPLVLIYLARRAAFIRDLAKTDRGIASLILLFAILGSLGILAASMSLPTSLMRLQWVAPMLWGLYGAEVALGGAGQRRALGIGLLFGVSIALLYFLIGVMSDPTYFISEGRINPWEPPLSGMYQVASYTPSGLLMATAVLLSTAPLLPKGAYRPALFVAGGSVVVATGLFGSRGALVMAAVMAALLAHCVTQRRLRRRVFVSGVLVAATAAGYGLITSPEASGELGIASIERLGDTFSQEGDGAPASPGGYLGPRAEFLKGEGLAKLATPRGVGRQFFAGYRDPSEGLSRESSHNSYLEMIVDFGFFGIIFVCVAVGVWLTRAFSAIRKARSLGGNGYGWPLMWLGALVVTTLVVSANIRLPLVEPYAAQTFYLALGLLLGYLHKRPEEGMPYR